MKLSRRDFLKGSLAAAASVSLMGVAAGAQSAEEQVEKEEESLLSAAYDKLDASSIEEMDADLVVLGAGPAGMAGAITAAEQGLKVVVFEKTGSSGGCAKFGMGPLAIGSDIQKQQGIDLDLDEMFNMFTEYTHFRTNSVLMRRYFETSAETLKWLEDMGVQFDEAAKYFEKSYPTWHLVHSEDGVVGGGQARTMTLHMQAKAEELGVQFYFKTPAVRIEKEDNKVSGICAISEDETAGYHVSAKAVLVATGGFGNNPEWVKQYFDLTLGEDFFGMQFPGHEGDGIRMTWEAGGKQSAMIEEMIYDIFRPESQGSYTNDIKLVMEQANLLVNREGKRFFNEELVQNTTYTGNALCNETDHTGFMILDENIKKEYVEANDVPLKSRVWNADDYSQFDANFDKMEADGYTAIVRANTLEELAEKLGIDAEGLLATVEEYNAMCEEGYDPLGKSAEFLKPITTAPFYGAQFFPSSYGTLGGIKVNADLEVINTEDKVIAGLYSAGTDSCTVYGDSYMFLLPGNTMGYSINSGRFAGMNVVTYVNGSNA